MNSGKNQNVCLESQNKTRNIFSHNNNLNLKSRHFHIFAQFVWNIESDCVNYKIEKENATRAHGTAPPKQLTDGAPTRLHDAQLGHCRL